jgi:hypothetical protein
MHIFTLYIHIYIYIYIYICTHICVCVYMHVYNGEMLARVVVMRISCMRERAYRNTCI